MHIGHKKEMQGPIVIDGSRKPIPQRLKLVFTWAIPDGLEASLCPRTDKLGTEEPTGLIGIEDIEHAYQKGDWHFFQSFRYCPFSWRKCHGHSRYTILACV